MIFILLKWAHLVAMLGMVGALVLIQFGLPGEVQDSYGKSKRANRIVQYLLAIGLAAGLALFLLKIRLMNEAGTPIDSKSHMITGFKFIAAILTGAFLGIGGMHMKKGRHFTAGIFRLASIVALSIAAFLGVLVSA